ncbi:tetratricopeptide repeat protein [Pseudohalioglobus lutimaris]|uniref:Tetratricopeptide repeat protein n=1 Tax=Pseudohalioglobus lutimaris TaxID=1737061 RepID=A0A2N5X645_9GAMM|nr:tetratricopeptide repeat protein [Pseudohalioglobus lutimaris]PLW69959.1 hypothetical protein C0039_05425 [Pseudohalioglobus lutimaris]
MKFSLSTLIVSFTLLASACSSVDYHDTIWKAATSQNQGDFASAEQHHGEAVAQMRLHDSVSSDELAVQLSNQASALNLLNRPDEAEVLLLESIDLLRSQETISESDFFTVTVNLARTYELQHRLDEAERLYLQSLKVVSNLPDWPESRNRFVYAGLANVYAWKGEQEPAMRYFKLAEQLYTQDFGADSFWWTMKKDEFLAIQNSEGT